MFLPALDLGFLLLMFTPFKFIFIRAYSMSAYLHIVTCSNCFNRIILFYRHSRIRVKHPQEIARVLEVAFHSSVIPFFLSREFKGGPTSWRTFNYEVVHSHLDICMNSRIVDRERLGGMSGRASVTGPTTKFP